MDYKYMSSQNNRYGCKGDCLNCPFASKPMYNSLNSIPTSNYERMRQPPYDGYIERVVNDFFEYVPQTILWYDNNGACHTQYEWLQDYLLEYCRKNYPWETPIYMETNSGQIVLISDSCSYEERIKEIFKMAIDIAAKVTKYKDSQASIIFDGLGLVLADDIKEAVRKVISILEKARKMGAFR